MKAINFKSQDRGSANYGWLQANYSFSFANYYDPEKINFGALRVLNDDIIEAGMGFGKHPHDNMEIISVPLKGTMKHKDSMSNEWLPLAAGEVQVMSAGSGLMHSEMNQSHAEDVNLFQIWIITDTRDVTPRYDQKKFDPSARKNKLQTLVSSINDSVDGSLNIHQDALISRVDLDANNTIDYTLKSKTHGVFAMVIDGEVSIDNEILSRRDAIGISETTQFNMKATKDSELILIEVPMFF